MFCRVRVPETASNTPPERAKTERDYLRTREKRGVPEASQTVSPSQTVSSVPSCPTVSNRLTNPILPHRLKPSHKSQATSPSQTVSSVSYCLTVSNRLTNPILPHRLKPSHKSHTASPSQTVSQIPYCLTVSNCLIRPILPHRLKPSHKSQTASSSQTVSPLRTKSAVRREYGDITAIWYNKPHPAPSAVTPIARPSPDKKESLTSHKPFSNRPQDVQKSQSLLNAHASQDDGTPLSVKDARHAVAREYNDWDALTENLHLHGASGSA